MHERAAREEAHAAHRQPRHRRRAGAAPGLHADHGPRGGQPVRLLAHGRREAGRQRGVVELRGVPGTVRLGRSLRARSRRIGRCRGRRRSRLRLVRQHQHHPVPAHAARGAAALRVAQRAARRQAGAHAVVEARRHRAVRIAFQRRQQAGGHVLLRALDEARVGQRGQRFGGQLEQVGAGCDAGAHACTFSASQPASWPGVIAPICAPSRTSRAAISRS
jgi:hypothetical protein